MPLANGHNHIIQLSAAPNVEPEKINPIEIAKEWLLDLESYLSEACPISLAAVVHEDSWWRDMLVLEWDFHILNGIHHIESFIGKNQPRVRLGNFCLRNGNGGCKPKIESPVPGLHWLSVSFECIFGRGSSVVYLTQEREGGK